MEQFKGLNIYEDLKGISIEGVKDFDPIHTFTCGQCFRWRAEEDKSFTGVAKGRVANISFDGQILSIKNSTTEDFKRLWFDYLDLGRDYGQIKEELKKDEIMEKAIAFGHGIRILKQDFYETLISFITSANNGIPRIMSTVEVIAQNYGAVVMMEGKSYYTFPDINKLANSTIEELWICKGGFRCKYIINSAAMIASGKASFGDLPNMATDKAQEELMKLPGVGPKVADCILLYSGTKQDVFPTDVWVKRVMEELYFKREASFKEIQQFAREKFGDNCGIAQQYLFYYARQNKIGTKK